MGAGPIGDTTPSLADLEVEFVDLDGDVAALAAAGADPCGWPATRVAIERVYLVDPGEGFEILSFPAYIDHVSVWVDAQNKFTLGQGRMSGRIETICYQDTTDEDEQTVQIELDGIRVSNLRLENIDYNPREPRNYIVTVVYWPAE